MPTEKWIILKASGCSKIVNITFNKTFFNNTFYNINITFNNNIFKIRTDAQQHNGDLKAGDNDVNKHIV